MLMSVKPLGHDANPYLQLLFAALSPDAEVAFFSWWTALLGRYDVLHVHWPDALLRASTAPRGVVKLVLLAALLLRCRIAGRPVVWTVHNHRPHELGFGSERLGLALFTRSVDRRIYLQPDSSARPADVVVPHGHYRDWYTRLEGADGQGTGTRVLCFGHLRPYKGVEALIAAARGVPDPDFRLRIVGRPADEAYGALLQQLAEPDPRISLDLSYLSDDQLVREVSTADVVVLPYRQMYNSGALLLSLSLDVQVLVPATASNATLATEAGAGWVHLYEGDLTPSRLADASQDVRDRPPALPPDLSARDWEPAGRRHVAVYRDLLDRRRRRQRPGAASAGGPGSHAD